MFIDKRIIEQIIFITNQKKLDLVHDDMKKGKISILTKLESKMLKDIRDLR